MGNRKPPFYQTLTQQISKDIAHLARYLVADNRKSLFSPNLGARKIARFLNIINDNNPEFFNNIDSNRLVNFINRNNTFIDIGIDSVEKGDEKIISNCLAYTNQKFTKQMLGVLGEVNSGTSPIAEKFLQDLSTPRGALKLSRTKLIKQAKIYVNFLSSKTELPYNNFLELLKVECNAKSQITRVFEKQNNVSSSSQYFDSLQYLYDKFILDTAPNLDYANDTYIKKEVSVKAKRIAKIVKQATQQAQKIASDSGSTKSVVVRYQSSMEIN